MGLAGLSTFKVCNAIFKIYAICVRSSLHIITGLAIHLKLYKFYSYFQCQGGVSIHTTMLLVVLQQIIYIIDDNCTWLNSAVMGHGRLQDHYLDCNKTDHHLLMNAANISAIS